MKTIVLTLQNPVKSTKKRRSENTLAQYSPDIAPSGYNFFGLMAHDLASKLFNSYKDSSKWLDSRTALKDEHLYRYGIQALPERSKNCRKPWTIFLMIHL